MCRKKLVDGSCPVCGTTANIPTCRVTLPYEDEDHPMTIFKNDLQKIMDEEPDLTDTTALMNQIGQKLPFTFFCIPYVAKKRFLNIRIISVQTLISYLGY